MAGELNAPSHVPAREPSFSSPLRGPESLRALLNFCKSHPHPPLPIPGYTAILIGQQLALDARLVSYEKDLFWLIAAKRFLWQASQGSRVKGVPQARLDRRVGGVRDEGKALVGACSTVGGSGNVVVHTCNRSAPSPPALAEPASGVGGCA